MSQVKNQEVIKHLRATQDHQHKDTDYEQISTDVFGNKNTKRPLRDPSDRYPTEAAMFNVPNKNISDKNVRFTTETSTQVIRSYYQNGKQHTELTIQRNPTFLTSVKVKTGEKSTEPKNPQKEAKYPNASYCTPSILQVKSNKYSPVEYGLQNVGMATAYTDQSDQSLAEIEKPKVKRNSQTSYTYKIQNGVAILQAIERCGNNPTATNQKNEKGKKENEKETLRNSGKTDSKTKATPTLIRKTTNEEKTHMALATTKKEEKHSKDFLKDNKDSKGLHAIKEFKQHSSTVEIQETVPPPKVDKRNQEGWISHIIKQEELRSELQPPVNTQPTDKVQFFQDQETNRVFKANFSKPGKIIIPNFSQDSLTLQTQQTSPPPKLDKRKAKEWITHTTKHEELTSELPPPTNKLSAHKVQFLQIQETQPATKVDGPSPGRLVIPHFEKQTSTFKADEKPPPPKAEKYHAEQWITTTIRQEELRSETPAPANKLTADKLHFLQTQDTQPAAKADGVSPGRIVIPDFEQHSSAVEIQETVPPPKVDKRNQEQWITHTIKQEELRSELPPPVNKLPTDKVQFLQDQQTHRVDKANFSTPGRIIIPDFSQDSSTLQTQQTSPPPKLDKRKAEKWITHTTKHEELRSELPPPTNKLSAHKVQFLQIQETQPATKVDGPSPGRLVIPHFEKQTSTFKADEKPPPPKAEKYHAEQWITTTIKQEELRSEIPAPTNKLTADKLHFLQTQDTQPAAKADGVSPGRIVIPDFEQHSSAVEIQETVPPPKVDKRNQEQWITHTIKQEELRSELPPPVNKLPTDKVQFLQDQQTHRVDKANFSTPGRIIIPDFSQDSSTLQTQQTSPPPKLDKRKAEEWITHTTKHEELRSEPPPPTNKLSAHKVQFLQIQETQPATKVDGPSPGRLVIPHFEKQTSTFKADEKPPPPKAEKYHAEQWITTTIKQEELRSEIPAPTNKLTADKLHFLQTQDTQPAAKADGVSPGRIVIPDFEQHSSAVEIQETVPPPKVDKRNQEQWITHTIKQEELRSELPPPVNKLPTDKVQFLQDQQTHRVDKANFSTPGRIIIPDFSQDSSTLQTQQTSPPPKLDKRKAEEWITHTTKHEELRSEPPPPTNKLSAHKVQFLQIQETQPATKVDGPSPGRLVIPHFEKQTSTFKADEKPPPPKAEKYHAEQWITTTIKQEELRSEIPAPANKLTADKLHFLQTQDTQPAAKADGVSPGRIVIPDFEQHSSAVEIQETVPPPKVDKRNQEQWITHTIKQEEFRSELPPPLNKLPTDKVQFLQDQQTHRVDKENFSTPGRIIIPDFSQDSSTLQTQQTSPPPKLDKRKAEEWITHTTKHEELRSEPPPPTNKLSAHKVQFLQIQETQPATKVDGPSPGRLVIPHFEKQTSTFKADEKPPPPKAEKYHAEQWITTTIKQEELRSEIPAPTNKLTADKLHFLQTQDTQPAAKADGVSPGRIVIPDFEQHSSAVEIQETVPPPKVDKRNQEQWITHTIKQEELRSELPPPVNKLPTDKVQFLQDQQTHRVDKANFSTPGRIIIPDFSQDSSTLQTQQTSPPPKLDKRKAEEWITHTTKHEELRSEPPPPTNKLSAHKVQFLQIQETQPATKVDGPSPGRLVIPHFEKQTSTFKADEKPPPPKAEKYHAEQWITTTIKQEELRSEIAAPANKLTADKLHFLQTQDTQPAAKADGVSPGRIVIPDFEQHSSAVEIQETVPPPKVDKRNQEQWITHTIKQEEFRSELPPPLNKLPTDKVQFLQDQQTHRVDKENFSTPGRIIIPDFSQDSSTLQTQQTSPPPKLDKRKAEEWITHTTKHEELRSEPPPPTNKLSAHKVQFLQIQETQPATKVDGPSPGRLVIPHFEKQTSTFKADEKPPPPKAEKYHAEQWITTTIKQEELRSEIPAPTNKLTADKLHFLQTQDTQPAAKADGVSPGRIVIPDFEQHSSAVEMQETVPPPKVDKRNQEQWITHTIKQEELRSELPPPVNKLPTDKVQFLQDQQTHRVDKANFSTPGRIIIPDFSQDSSTLQTQQTSPPPKLDKRKAEKWITHTTKHEELRSEPPPPTNKLSAHKVQFLQIQETQPATKVDGPSPGRLVIPNFEKQTSTFKADEKPPPPKAEKYHAEQWITTTIKQEELRSEIPAPANKLTADKLHFLQTQDTQPAAKADGVSPGRIVIRDFEQHSSAVEIQETVPPPKVDKRNQEQWITHTIKQEELRSELPPPVNKLPTDKVQFLQDQQTHRVDKANFSTPGRIIIPDFSQDSSTLQTQQTSPPPKLDKRKAEEWITHTTKHEELRSEPPPPTNKLSAHKVQFLQIQETQPATKVDGPSPGRLVIPHFEKQTSTFKADEKPPPPKAEKYHAEQWITTTIKQEELRSEIPAPANKLTADKLHFLQTQDTQPAAKADGVSPGRIVIPDFEQHSSAVEIQETVPPPKVDKRNQEQWITHTIKQEELRSELPPPVNQLPTDKVQFLQDQQTHRVDKANFSTPGRIIIPDFSQDSSTLQTQQTSPPPKLDKRKAEEWITHTTKHEELRSEPPPPTNKLSAHKVQFLQIQETQPATKVDGPSPGRLVIPHFEKQTSTFKADEKPPPPKAEKYHAEQWITTTIKQEELRSEIPAPANKLTADKLHFLQTQDTQPAAKADGVSPGRIVIPDFEQHSSAVEIQETVPPPKVDKRNQEQWITHTIKQEELRSELPPPVNKLPTDKVQFLQDQQTHRVDKANFSTPGRIIIPDFSQDSSTLQTQQTSPPPKLDKRKAEEWITHTTKHEELRSEPPPPTNKLSAHKVQFLQIQETQPATKVDGPSPGRLVIPHFEKQTSTFKADEKPPPPKAEKYHAEQWITTTIKQEELRSEIPAPANKLTADKLHFLQTQDTQPAAKADGVSPGRIVIPDFEQHSSAVEIQETVPPPKVDKRNQEQWITHTIKQEELRSELPPPVNKLPTDKVQFLQDQQTHRVDKANFSTPGRIIIPDFSQDSSTLQTQQTSPPPKLDKRKAEEWITHTTKHEELRSEPPPPTNKLSAHKVQFLQIQETQPATKVDGPSPGRLVIPHFEKQTSTFKADEKPPPPKAEKYHAEQWITTTIKQEELRSEIPAPANKLTADKLHFLQTQDTQPAAKADGVSPGRIVIPDFEQHSSAVEIQETVPPPKVDKRNQEQWITHTIKQEELRSELPPPVNKLPTDKVQFLQDQQTHRVDKANFSTPGRITIPDFSQDSSTLQTQQTSPPPKLDKRKAEEWITHTTKHEELRSEPPPPTNKLSAHKVQFLQIQETQPATKVDGPSPGRLVIPNFEKQTSTFKADENPPPPKAEKYHAEQWITTTIKQEELRSEIPAPANKLTADKLRFLQTQDTQPAAKADGVSPGRIVIPDFEQHSSAVEIQETVPPPKVDKRNQEQWITHTIKQEELRSELPPPVNKLPTDKVQFLQDQQTHRVDKANFSTPGRIIIPDFSQDSSTLQTQQTSPPPKLDKRKAEEWITHTTKHEELRSEPPPPTNKLSAHIVQFLQIQETQPATKVDGPSPGRLVIPNFEKQTSTFKADEKPPPPKAEKYHAEQWITTTIKQEELRSEIPAPANKLTADKLHFLQTQDTQPAAKADGVSPGRIVIPDFEQHSSAVEIQETVPPPKVDKRNQEQWITHTIKQEELRSELPPPVNKLPTDKVQFLQDQQTHRVDKANFSTPGRIIIPDFSQDSSTLQTQQTSPPPKLDKRKAEEWITHTTKHEELRSEPPPPTNKLSAHKVQFLQIQETQPATKVDGPSPGRLVIPNFEKQTSTFKADEKPPPPKAEKYHAEQWITTTTKQEELRSEIPAPANKLTADKLRFLQTQDTQPAAKADGVSPGRIVIPDFEQHSSAVEIQETVPPPKVDKRNQEQWITHTIKQEELRSELPPPVNKLPTDKVQFLQDQQTHRVDKANFSTPGRIIIPDFSQDSSTLQTQQTSPPPKLDKRKAEEWITHTTKHEELRSEPPPPTNKLSAHKVQFLQIQETQPTTKVDGPSPGRLVIPHFEKQTSTFKADEKPPPPKAEKYHAEQWITTTIKQEELRSEIPAPANKLTADKLHFLQTQDTQPAAKADGVSPGRIVIPDFEQHSSAVEIQETVPPPKVDKRNQEQWITHTIKQEELRSELPPPVNKLPTDKVQFLQDQQTHRVDKANFSTPGRIIIPDFSQDSSTLQTQQTSPPPKLDKRKAEEWITHTTKHEELRSEPPPPTNKLSAHKVQFLQIQETQPATKVDGPSPGRLVIPHFEKQTSTFKADEKPPPPKAEKYHAEQWITTTIKQEELRSEIPAPANKLTADKLHFLQTQDTQPAAKADGVSPGRIVIPDFEQHSSAVEIQETVPPPKVDKRNQEQWITHTIKQEELRSELPPPVNKLPTDKVQFLQDQQTHRVDKANFSTPGRIIIPDFSQDSSTLQTQQTSPPPKLDKRKAEEWITHTTKHEELRSELPPSTNKLSAHKVQFLQIQETQPATKADGPSPGRLVIPHFEKQTSTWKADKKPPPPKGEKVHAEQWITTTIKQEELRSEIPAAANKLAADKLQFLQTQDTHLAAKADGVSPGRLVIPDFKQHSFTVEVQETVCPSKVDKGIAERWLSHTIKQEELRSELPPSVNKLPTENVLFLEDQETQTVEKANLSRPGNIPDFNQDSSTSQRREGETLFDGTKGFREGVFVNQNRSNNQAINNTCEKVFLEEKPRDKALKTGNAKPISVAQLNNGSVFKLQFVQTVDADSSLKEDIVLPGRLVIPDFRNSRMILSSKDKALPLEIDKHGGEEWVTHCMTREEVSSIPLRSRSKLSEDKVGFLTTKEVQQGQPLLLSTNQMKERATFFDNQESQQFTGRCNHLTGGGEVLLSGPSNKRSEEKFELTYSQDVQLLGEMSDGGLRNKLPASQREFKDADKAVAVIHRKDSNDKTLNLTLRQGTPPGGIVIPNNGAHSFSIDVQGPALSGKKNNIQTEWLTHSLTHEQIRTLPIAYNQRRTVQQTQESQPIRRLDNPVPRKLVIPATFH